MNEIIFYGFILAINFLFFFWYMFSEKEWIDTAGALVTFTTLSFLAGIEVEKREIGWWYTALILLIIICGIIGRVYKLHFKEENIKKYTRKDLVRAQEIYYENYLEDPDSYKPIPTKGGAAYHMDYLLGIIDQNRKILKEKTTLKE